MSIYKGDNTAAYGGAFITIAVMNPDLVKISKIVFVRTRKTSDL